MSNKLAIISSKDKREIIQQVISSSLDPNTYFKFSNIDRVDIYDILRTWRYEDVDKVLIDIDSAVEYSRVNDLLVNLPKYQAIENSNGDMRIWLMCKNPAETYDRKFKRLVNKLGCEEIIVGDKLDNYELSDVQSQSHQHQYLEEKRKTQIQRHEEVAVNVPENVAVAELKKYGISDDDINIQETTLTESKIKKPSLREQLPKTISTFLDDEPDITEKKSANFDATTNFKEPKKSSIESISKPIKEDNFDSESELSKKTSEQKRPASKMVDDRTVHEVETQAHKQLENVVMNATIGSGDSKQVLIVLPPEYVKPQVRISFAERMYWRIKSSVKNFLWTLITVVVMSGIATYLINSNFGSEVRAWIKNML